MDEFNQQQEALLGGALNELAIAPLPLDFVNQVLANIHSANTFTPAAQANSDTPVRFRLQFLDIALALFWSSTLAGLWMIILWWTGLLRLDWLPQAQLNFSLIDQLSNSNPAILIVLTILLLVEISFLGLLGWNLLGERPS